MFGERVLPALVQLAKAKQPLKMDDLRRAPIAVALHYVANVPPAVRKLGERE